MTISRQKKRGFYLPYLSSALNLTKLPFKFWTKLGSPSREMNVLSIGEIMFRLSQCMLS